MMLTFCGSSQWSSLVTTIVMVFLMGATVAYPMNNHGWDPSPSHQMDPTFRLMSDGAHSPARSDHTMDLDQIPDVGPDDEATSSYSQPQQHGDVYSPHLPHNDAFWSAALDPTRDYREAVEMFQPPSPSSEATVQSNRDDHHQDETTEYTTDEALLSFGGPYGLPDPKAYKSLHGSDKKKVIDNYQHYVRFSRHGTGTSRGLDRQTIRKQVGTRTNMAMIQDLLSDDEAVRHRAAQYISNMRLPVGIGDVNRALKDDAWDVIGKIKDRTAWNLKGIIGRLAFTLGDHPQVAPYLKDDNSFNAAFEFIKMHNQGMSYGDDDAV